MSFEQYIQEWIDLDEQVKMYNDKLKQLREKRNIIEEKVTAMANTNKLLNTSFKFKNNNLKIVNSKVVQPLSLKFLEKSLGNIIQNGDQVKRIVNYIRNNREIKIIQEIKRLSNN